MVADIVPRQRVQPQADHEAAEQVHEGFDAEEVQDRRVEGDLHHRVRHLEVGNCLNHEVGYSLLLLDTSGNPYYKQKKKRTFL